MLPRRSRATKHYKVWQDTENAEGFCFSTNGVIALQELIPSPQRAFASLIEKLSVVEFPSYSTTVQMHLVESDAPFLSSLLQATNMALMDIATSAPIKKNFFFILLKDLIVFLL